MKRTVMISGKVDLDTVGVGFLFGVTRKDNVVILRNGLATVEDLVNPEVICIEVGGSGRVKENNWDHHDSDGPTESATLQGLLALGDFFVTKRKTLRKRGHLPTKSFSFAFSAARYGELVLGDSLVKRGGAQALIPLVEYIDVLDTEGPRALPGYGKVKFPCLSDVFAGMLLTTRDPVEQFYRGVELLEEVVRTGQDPFGTIKGFDSYAEAKAVNNRQVSEAGRTARWSVTESGHKFGYLETDFYGAPGVLYGLGAEIVVAFAPRFGNPPVPKFTVAGNGVRVDAALQRLNELELGWGGPPTGTIIGSPREGSKLSLEQIVGIVKKVL